MRKNISIATGADSREIRKLFTYEYTVITLPIVMFYVVVISSIIDKIKNTYLIPFIRNQFLPCIVDWHISIFLLLLKKDSELAYPHSIDFACVS